MNLSKDIDALFEIAIRLEERQKKGETAKPQEVESLKSITLTIESIAECMVPEKKTKIKSQKESLYV